MPRKHKEHITTQVSLGTKLLYRFKLSIIIIVQTTTKRMGRKGYKTADSGLQGVLTAQRALVLEVEAITNTAL